MKLCNRDKWRLRQMLECATRDQEALIDAHCITYSRTKRGEKIIPKEFLPLTRRWERDIKAWRKLVDKLTNET